MYIAKTHFFLPSYGYKNAEVKIRDECAIDWGANDFPSYKHCSPDELIEGVKATIPKYKEILASKCNQFDKLMEDSFYITYAKCSREVNEHNVAKLEKILVFKKYGYKTELNAEDFYHFFIRKRNKYQRLLVEINDCKDNVWTENDLQELKDSYISYSKKRIEEDQKNNKLLTMKEDNFVFQARNGKEVCIEMLNPITHHLESRVKIVNIYLKHDYVYAGSSEHGAMVILKPKKGYEYTQDFEDELLSYYHNQ